MTNYITGTPRRQLYLFNECLDELVDEKNVVRFIDAYVESLDLRSLGFRMNEDGMGAPAYRPQLKLKIYMYGYFEKIRSSRKLEKECKRNNELMWLTEGLAPDFKTIADFRRDNKKGIQLVFRDFLKICHRAGLLSFELVGIDGSKIGAQNHNNNVYRREDIDNLIAKIEIKIDEYLKEMDATDKEMNNELEFLSENVEERLKKLKTSKEKAEMIKKIFVSNPEIDKYYANDPESRFMNDKGKLDVSYNVQAAVDAKNKLFVAIDVTNENNDIKQMNGMCNQVEEIKRELEVGQETIKVADAGYYSEPQILECCDNGHEIYMPNPEDEHRSRNQGNNIKRGIREKGYHVEKFKYDDEQDVYICPEGQILKRCGKAVKTKSGKQVYRYSCNQSKNCVARKKCTKNSSGRLIEVPVRKEEIHNFKLKVRSIFGKRIIEKRKEICEHPFGTIKRTLGFTHFLMKGKDSALMESSLMGFVYNLKRALNCCGMAKLMDAIG